MKNDLTKRGGSSPFDQIRQIKEDGSEYWSARDLSLLLGYSKSDWRYFEKVIEKAKIACQKSNQNDSHHFVVSNKMIKIASGSHKEADREIDDFHLSRYACYLIAQNGNPSKKEIADAQTYFAVKTHEREIDEELAKLGKREKRRELLKTYNKNLAIVAKKHGVESFDLGLFYDFGTRGLYTLNTKELRVKKGISCKQNLLDKMGTAELGYNIAKATLAEEKLKKIPISDKNTANKVHLAAGQAMRKAIIESGVALPENLPIEPDIGVSKKMITNPSKVYLKSHILDGETIFEIYLPIQFNNEHKNQLLDLFRNNPGSARVFLYLGRLVKEVGNGVNCNAFIKKEIEKIFFKTKKLK
ncbi:MAG: DNA damage-inducible protein D [Patescibacteria group bacterium]